LFTDKLVETARELVSNFNSIHPELGIASTPGRDIQVPTSVNRTVEQILRSIDQGADRGELVPRIIERLVQTSPVEKGAAEGTTNFFGGPSRGPRQRWTNQIANQVVEPLQLFYPRSLHDSTDKHSIAAILSRALATGCAVKAAGSGHSYSDVATTPDFLINTHGLCRVASEPSPIAGQLSSSTLRSPLPLSLGPLSWPTYDPENNHALIEMEAGIRIHELNKALEQRDLGLINMGGYDGQTIIGATSTSTHGSGITLPPFPDMVRSLVLATTGRWNGPTTGGNQPTNGVYFYRIEPKNGITDPAKYKDPLVQLIQDDDCFYSAICSMGCFGVIYSVVFEVMQMYWLEETRTETTLDKLMSDLQPDTSTPGHFPKVLQNTRNYEVIIHPYPIKDGKVIDMDPGAPPETYYPYFLCLVTQRHIVPKPDTISGSSGHRNIISQFLSRFKVSFELVVALLNKFPGLVPFALTESMASLVDDSYINKSFEIYNLGLNQDAGFAAEVGFSLQDDAGNYTTQYFTAAIDRIHQIGRRARQQGEQYQTSPFSLRFVKASAANLSMMNGRNTAMIEMDMLTGTYAGREVMYRYETCMYSLGGRPHWGLDFDCITGNNDLLRKMYTKLDNWLGVYRQFNALGTFNNSFTDRVGFTVFE